MYPACSVSSPRNTRTDRSNIFIWTGTGKSRNSCPGVFVPLKPFPGTLGVARKEPGRYSSVPPGEYAGNMDIRDFVEGTTLYVPVHVAGALLWTGDSHAAQGNGEVNLTAIETAYKELSLTVEVVKTMKLDMPRIETPKSWITMGFDADLNKALDIVKEQTAKFLAEQRKISVGTGRGADAQVSDCRVSQVVNIKKGIHCLNPKNPQAREDMERPLRETPRYYVQHAQDRDLNTAMDKASRNMIQWLERKRHPAAGCVRTCQCCDGLPGRRRVGGGEACALLDAEEPVGREEVIFSLSRKGCRGSPFLLCLFLCAPCGLIPLHGRKFPCRSWQRRPICAVWPRRWARNT